MARRRTRSKSRWLPWTPGLAELFRLTSAMAGWTPPAQARLTAGQSRRTLSARFVDQDGRVMTARIRLARDAHADSWDCVGEELSIPLGRIEGGRSE